MATRIRKLTKESKVFWFLTPKGERLVSVDRPKHRPRSEYGIIPVSCLKADSVLADDKTAMAFISSDDYGPSTVRLSYDGAQTFFTNP